jgi:hypothetical protein
MIGVRGIFGVREIIGVREMIFGVRVKTREFLL